jgi:hypothetical protein
VEQFEAGTVQLFAGYDDVKEPARNFCRSGCAGLIAMKI